MPGAQSEKKADEKSQTKNLPDSENLPEDINGSLQFLKDTLRLDKESDLKHNNRKNDYEFERYDFEEAIDLLRPEYATAVILKTLTQENIQSLLALDFEVALVVLKGEIVLFTTGNEEEIGALKASRQILKKADFISHTHVSEEAQSGPSPFDLNVSVFSPDQEYVLTQSSVFAYNRDGIVSNGASLTLDDYLAALNQSLSERRSGDSAASRRILNRFIRDVDLYNEAAEEDREAFRRGGTLSYTTGLTSTSVTTLSGTPLPYLTPGSSAGTTLSYNATTTLFQLGYSVPNAGDLSGLRISFDNETTPAVETQNLSMLANLTFGLRGPNTTVELKITDINGVEDTFTLTNIINTTERFWRIPVASISSALDKTKIKNLQFIVRQANTTTTTRTGTFYIRAKGLNIAAPTQPVITSAVPAATNQTTLTLTGTKEANTAILINNIQVIPQNSSTAWTATVNLPVEGNNTFSITAKNSIGKVSTVKSITVRKDTIVPTGSININSGAVYAASAAVTLNLSGTDSGSGIDKMSFSTDNAAWTNPEAYAATKTFTLPSGEGSKTVYVKYFDKAGNVSAVYSKSIILDTLPPSGTVQVNGGVQAIKQTSVTLNLSASDAGSGLDKMSFSSNNSTWSTAEVYAATKAWTFSAGDGNKTVYVKFLDKSGKWSTPVSVTVLMDTVVPTGSVNVNSGAVYANNAQVTLNLSGNDAASGMDKMSFSTDNVNWTASESYAASKTFALPSGDGNKTVYVKYYDKAGNVSSVYSKSIILDTTIPTAAVNINNNAVYTNAQQINLALTASDNLSGVVDMSFALDSTNAQDFSAWESFASVKLLNLTTQGNHQVYVRVRDAAGNIALVSDSIIYDSIAPSGSIQIENNAAYAFNRNVTLSLTASDSTSGIGEMRFSMDNGTSWTAWETFAVTKSLMLSEGEGLKEVQFQVRDSAGNISLFKDEILLSAQLPGITFTSQASTSNPLYALTYQAGQNLYTENWQLAPGVNSLLVRALIQPAMPSYAAHSVTLNQPEVPDPVMPEIPDLPSGLATVTTQEGFILKYQNGDLAAVEKPGEYQLFLPQLDAQGSLTGGVLVFNSGDKLLFENSKAVYRLQASGEKIFYSGDGTTIRAYEDDQGERIRFAFRLDDQGNIAAVLAMSQDFTALYEGNTPVWIVKNDGTDIRYQDGFLSTYHDQAGNLFEYSTTPISQNGNVTGFISEISSIKPAGNTAAVPAAEILNSLNEYPSIQDTLENEIAKRLEYDANKSIVKAYSSDGNTINFSVNGLLSSITGAFGTTFIQNQFDAQGNLAFIALTQASGDQPKTVYNAQGQLTSVEINGNTIHYKNAAIDLVEQSDRSRLQNIVFDANGQIKDAIYVSPEGHTRIYQNRQLVREIKADGTETDFINGAPVETRMSDGRVYEYVPDPDANDLTAFRAILKQYAARDGSLVILTNGAPSRIERADGSVLTDLRFGAAGFLLDAAIAFEGPAGESLTGLLRDGVMTQVTFPDGRTAFYENGYLVKITESSGEEISYTYQFNNEGDLTQFAVTESGETKTYSANGLLLKYETADAVAEYSGGVLQTISYQGIKIRGVKLDDSGNVTDGIIEAPDGNQYMLQDSALVSIQRPNGDKVFYQGDLISEVQTAAGKKIEYVYTRDENDHITAIQVKINGGTLLDFGEYLLDPSRTEETPVKETASEYNLLNNTNTWMSVNMAGAIPSSYWVYNRGNLNDPEAQFFISSDSTAYGSNTTDNRSGFRLTLLASRPISGESFFYLKMKKEGAANLQSVDFKITSNYDPSPLADFSHPLEMSENYQAFTIPITDSYSHSAMGYGLNFNPPLSPSDFWAFSVSQAAHYKISRLQPSEYTQYFQLSPETMLGLAQEGLEENFSSLVSGQNIFSSFNHLEETQEYPQELAYDENFDLISTKRTDNALVVYANDKVETVTDSNGVISTYAYENGRIKTITTSNPQDPDQNTITHYQYGKIRKVTKTDGTLIYKYSYEFEGNVEITVIEDVSTGEIKRYQNEQLLSALTSEGMLTSYFYENNKISLSVVTWQGRELHRFTYRYEGENTLITDEKGVTRTYDAQNKLIFLETAEGLGYQYRYLHDEDNLPVEEQVLYSAKADDGVTLFYKEDTVEKITLKDGTILNIAEQDPNLYQEILIKQGLVDQVIHITGEVATYVRDEIGRLLYVDVVKDGRTRRYTAEGRLVYVIEPDGTSAHYGYIFDAEGNIEKTRVVKRTPQLVGGVVPPARLQALSAGYLDGWTASISVNDNGLGKSNYNYWRISSEPWINRGYDIAILDAQGNFVKSGLFDLFGKGPNEATRMAEFLESVPEGYFAVMAVTDEGVTSLTDRAMRAIESFGSAEIRSLSYRGSFALIGRKGAAIGTAIEEMKPSGQGFVEIQSHATEYFYYDSAGQPLSYNQFTAVPQSMWQSPVQTLVGDTAEVFAAAGIGASGYRKNFNEYYPESGFVRMWNGQNADYSADAYVNELLAMTANAAEKAVYYDSRYPSNYAPPYYSVSLKNKLQQNGFKVINADELASFLINQGPDSVLVMSQDVMPDTVYNPLSPFSISKRNIPREYMNRGGTLVSTHDTPFYYLGHSDGTKEFVGEIGAKTVLGVTPAYRIPGGNTLSATQAPTFNLSGNEPSLDSSLLYFDTNVNFRTIRWDKVKESIHHTLDSDTTIVADYDQNGDVIALTKADRSVTVYENGKQQFVTDINGYMLVEYEYDLEGNLIAIHNAGQRRDIEHSVYDAKKKVSEEKYYALEDAALEKQLITQAFLDEVAARRAQFRAARNNVQNTLNNLEGQDMKGSKAKKAKSHALDDLRNAIREIEEAERQFLEDAANQLVALDIDLTAKLNEKKSAIEADSNLAFGEIDTQAAEYEKEIRKQEAVPVVIHYYRLIFGRDPTKQEIESFYPEAVVNGVINTAALSSNLRNSEEFLLRTTRAQSIRGELDSFLDAYLAAGTEQKSALLAPLGLNPSEVVSFTASDIQKIKDYLASQGLHFGESAIHSLKVLLEAHGISVPYESLAVKLILTDILAGVLHPHFADKEELLISLFAMRKVAGLYGVEAEGLRLSYENLKAAYTGKSSLRTIVHLNENHFVVVTAVSDTEVRLIESNGEEVTVSRAEFEKAWKGVAFTADQTVINQHSNQVLSEGESRQIRGAFFWIIPAIIGAIGSILGAIGGILASIGGILASIGEIVGTIITGFAQAIGGFLSNVGLMVKNIFSGIYALGTSLFKGLTSFFSFTGGKSLAAGALKGFTANTIFKNVIAVGLNYVTQKGLDALGIDPGLSRVFSSFVTGGFLGGFTSAGFDFGSFLASGLKSGLVSGAQDLLAQAGLDTELAGILSLTAGNLVGGIWQGNIGETFVKIAPEFVKDLAMYGIQKLGTTLGLDPTIARLIGLPLSAMAGGLVKTLVNPNGGGGPGFSFSTISNSLLSGVLSVGVDYVTEQTGLSPLIGSLTARAISGAIAGVIDPDRSIFESVYDAFEDSVLNVLSLGAEGEGLSQEQYARSFMSFADIIEQKGFAAAFETYAANIFRQDAISSMTQSFNTVGEYIQDVIDKNKAQTITKETGTFLRIQLSNGDYVDIDENFSYVDELKQGGRILRGEFAVDEFERWGLQTGSIDETFESGAHYQSFYQDGNNTEIQIDLASDIPDSQVPQFYVKKQGGSDGIILSADGEVRSADLQASDDSIFLSIKKGLVDVMEVNLIKALSQSEKQELFDQHGISITELEDTYFSIREERILQQNREESVMLYLKVFSFVTSDFQTDRSNTMAEKQADLLVFAYQQTEDYKDQPVLYKWLLAALLGLRDVKKPTIIKTEM